MERLHEEFGYVKSGKVVFFKWLRNENNWIVKYVSANVLPVLGYKPEDFLSGAIIYDDLIHPEDREQVALAVDYASTHKKNEFTHEIYRIKDSSGNYRYVYDHTQIIRDKNKQITHYQGYISDETEIIQQKERLELVLAGTGLGLWDWNPSTNTVVFDERWANMLGYQLSEIKPDLESWVSRVHPDDLDKCYQDIQDHIQQKTAFYNNIHRMMHKDGKWRYILDRGKVVSRDEHGNPIRFTGTHTDVTELKEIEIQLQEKTIALAETIEQLEKYNLLIEKNANTDALTGLPNRRYFKEHTEKMLAQAKRSNDKIALLYIDLDGFKKVNDEISHHTGDLVLSSIGDRFSHIVREGEMIARLGGDEFCMVVYGFKSNNELEHLVKRLMSQCHKPFNIEGKETKISMSIGIAIFPDNEQLLKDLVHAADKAMYSVKNNRAISYAFA
jgi:diguanylate cyclase (GGDEF)-like protein/PAS domain S-box-containing protein